MRRVALVAMLCLAGIACAAEESTAIVITTVTATGGWDAVTFDRGAIACIIKPRVTATAFQLAADDAGTTYMSFAAGAAFTLSSGTIGEKKVWVKATAGQIIEVLQQKQG